VVAFSIFTGTRIDLLFSGGCGSVSKGVGKDESSTIFPFFLGGGKDGAGEGDSFGLEK